MNAPNDMRQHILNAAKPVILGKGFSAAGLNEILASAGVPKGSFYHYFKSKEAFGEALLDEYFREYIRALDGLLGDASRPAAERLMAYWQEWQSLQCSGAPEGQCLAVKLGGEVSDLSEAMRSALLKGTRGIIARISVCIAEGQQDGSLAADINAPQTAQALYEMWLGATLLAKMWRQPEVLNSAMASTRQLLGLHKVQ